MSRYYNVHITAGFTSPGPYTIYWNTVSSGSIATIYGTSLPASGLTLQQLTGTTGINVMVPDLTTSIILYNTYCNQPQYFNATPTEKLYDFCMNILILDTSNNTIHFNPNGVDNNGKNKWISDDTVYQIVWSTSLNKWELQTWPCLGSICPIITSTSSYPPLTNWTISGLQGTVTVTEGVCSPSTYLKQINSSNSVNQPKCGCDGNIVINTKNLSNTVPPYTYSIDNGLTYSNSPFFNNLCTGIYNIKIKDSYNYIIGNVATLNEPTPPTTYSISLSTTNTTITNTTYTLTKEYKTTINITPPLPDGVTLSFDLIHNNNFNSSPNNNTSTISTNTSFDKNNTLIVRDSYSTTTGTTVNFKPSCQDLLVYQTGRTESWISQTITNTDTIIITTSTSVTKSEYELCTVGESADTYSLLNANISGCDCCNIIIT